MIKRTLLSILAAGTVLAAGAVKARPGIIKVQQPDGTTIDAILVGDEHAHMYLTPDSLPLERDAQGFLRKTSESRENALANMRKRRSESRRRRAAVAQNGLGVFSNSFPVTGDVKALVILVNYKDVKFKTPDAHTYFSNMLMQEGFSDYNGTGSARDYFVDNSMGEFRPEFDCYGPVELPQNRSYYGGNDRWGEDKAPEDMIKHAVEILDSEVDFSQYDTDGDGFVDNVYVFYAGEGEAGGGGDDTVWPHSYYIYSGAGKTVRADGVRFDYYACSNEWEGGKPDGIGTFVHEFSHVMGLPDLYDTEYENAIYVTPSGWSVLDSGNYNNDSRTPAGYGAFERNALGWNEPVLLDRPASEVLEEIGASNTSYIIQTEKTNEFFLLENRQKTGWDSYLPGHGMLIWHIDYNSSVWTNNSVNNNKSHQYVDLVEANNNANSRTTSNLAGYSWPGTKKKTSFTSTTTPALKSWAGKAIDLPITDITESNDLISFNVAGGGPSSSIAEVAAPESVLHVSGRTLSCDGLIEVYDLAGRLVVSGIGSVEVPAAGIYVARAAGTTAKLSVKF
ncbi:MAG: M6 family metalloprotease domain-containing protein [Muribaculaceae bacterium]|nr:M6 family metalloprotease domain-containing protein [Muribaculaceae bacterium]